MGTVGWTTMKAVRGTGLAGFERCIWECHDESIWTVREWEWLRRHHSGKHQWFPVPLKTQASVSVSVSVSVTSPPIRTSQSRHHNATVSGSYSNSYVWGIACLSISKHQQNRVGVKWRVCHCHCGVSVWCLCRIVCTCVLVCEWRTAGREIATLSLPLIHQSGDTSPESWFATQSKVVTQTHDYTNTWQHNADKNTTRPCNWNGGRRKNKKPIRTIRVQTSTSARCAPARNTHPAGALSTVSLSRKPNVPIWITQVALCSLANSFSMERLPRASATHKMRLPCTGNTDTCGLELMLCVVMLYGGRMQGSWLSGD